MTERPFDTQSADESSSWEPVADDGATAAPVAQGTSSTYTTGTLSASSTGYTDVEAGTVGGGAASTGAPTGAPTGGSSDTKQVVADEAASVAQDAKQSGKQVAETATAEAKNVAAEAANQGKQLLSQVRSELTDQVSSQHQRAAVGLHALADELGQMVSGTQQQGLASDLATQASERVRSVASWLENREPGDVLDEVRSFARRRPGLFLAAAAAVGVVGGRLTRGMTGDDQSASAQRGSIQRAGYTGGTSSPTSGAAYPTSGAAYVSDAPVGTGAAVGTGAFGADYVYETEPVAGTDPTRVDAGIDPATYTHPVPGADTDELGEGRR